VKTKAGIMGLVLLLLVGASAWAKEEKRPLRIGHRGARALVDENTLESLKAAAEIGVDMLEFDIQQTKDGVLVIMHDETVDRTTDGQGRIDQMTLEQFRELKTKSGYTPPSLDEVLDWLATNDLGFILDFKLPDPQLAERLVAVIEERGMLDRAVFESPVPRVAGQVEKIKPEAVTAIYPKSMPLMLILAEKYNVDQVSYQWIFATPGQILLAKATHHPVLVWTVNSRGKIRWFRLLNVHGIMTDDPNLFQAEKN